LNKAEFTKHLAKGKILPVYFFTGEQYQIDSALKDVLSRIFIGSGEQVVDTFYAKESDIEDVIRSIKNVSLFSNKKAIILKKAEELSSEKIKMLLPLIKEPPENTFIFIIANDDMKDDSLIELISDKYGTVVKFPEYKKDRELRDFILDELEEAGIKMDDDAVGVLIDYSGSALYNIKNEIEKLKLLYKGKKRLTISDIEESIFYDVKEDFYSIFNGICNRDSSLAIKGFRSIVKKDYEYLTLLSTISSYIYSLYKIRMLLDSGFSEGEIFLIMGDKNKFSFERKLQGARNYNKAELLSAIHRLSLIDIQLKSSSIDKMVLFDDFFLSLDRRVKQSVL